MSNEQLNQCHLELIGNLWLPPTPVFWIQIQFMTWNTVFPTGKTLKCAGEKKGSWRILNISYKTPC
jgi:hypothetical protein